VFSYVVVSDSGFAPNPFHGVCTLACCKPVIRRHAQVGDLIVGLSTRCERVVYAMKVSKVVGFDEYWRDAQGLAKRPDRSSSAARERRGDNIYEPLPDGGSVNCRRSTQPVMSSVISVASESCSVTRSATSAKTGRLSRAISGS
jgi:hypothetical protein